jgi:hypothetical protein
VSFGHVSFDLDKWYLQYQQPDSDTENSQSARYQTHYDATDKQ